MSSTRNEKNVSPTSPQAKLSAVASTCGGRREEEGSGTAETTAQCAPPPKTVRAVSAKQRYPQQETQLKMLRNWHITDVEAEEGNKAEETETTKKVTPEAVLDFNAADAECNDEDTTESAASTDSKNTQEEFQLQSKKRKKSLPGAATDPDKKKKNMRESAIPGDQGDDTDAPEEVSFDTSTISAIAALAASAEAQKANKQDTRLEHERLLQDIKEMGKNPLVVELLKNDPEYFTRLVQLNTMANHVHSARAEAEKEKTARERSDQLLADVRAQLTVANQNNQDQQEDLDSLRQDLDSLRQENDH